MFTVMIILQGILDKHNIPSVHRRKRVREHRDAEEAIEKEELLLKTISTARELINYEPTSVRFKQKVRSVHHSLGNLIEERERALNMKKAWLL